MKRIGVVVFLMIASCSVFNSDARIHDSIATRARRASRRSRAVSWEAPDARFAVAHSSTVDVIPTSCSPGVEGALCGYV